ncbi:MAG TPA: ester cyclase [Thermomicrobiales bacterium]|nr:ester cyclase [Thermomicrobiales bacterium]
MLRRMLFVGAVVALCLGWLPDAAVPQAAAAQASPSPCAANTNEEIRSLTTDFDRAFVQGDIDTLAQLISPDIVRDTPMGDQTGSDETLASFSAFFEAFPDLTSDVDLLVVDAPLAALHYIATATQASTFFGNEPPGQPVTFAGMFLLTFECGKVVHMYSEVDQLSQRGQSTSTPATPVAEAGAASPESCSALTDETATTLMDTWYHDVWTGQADLLATLTTPDIYHHWAQGPDSSGQDAQLAHVQATIDMLPGLTSDYDAMAVDGDLIAVHWTQTLGDDSWGGLNIFHTTCGLIDEVWSEMDLNELPGLTGEATPGA